MKWGLTGRMAGRGVPTRRTAGPEGRRLALEGRWGDVDVADMERAADHLASWALVEHDVPRVDVNTRQANLRQEMHGLEQLPRIQPNELFVQRRRLARAVFCGRRLQWPTLRVHNARGG